MKTNIKKLMAGLACALFFGAAGSSKAEYYSESAELGSATEAANPDKNAFEEGAPAFNTQAVKKPAPARPPKKK